MRKRLIAPIVFEMRTQLIRDAADSGPVAVRRSVLTRLRALSVPALAALIIISCSDDSTGPSDAGISMSDAVEIVKDSVLTAEVPQGCSFVCIRMSGTIPEGSTIEEDAPAGWQTPLTRTAGASFAVDEESYFFYLDLAPRTFYEHPVKYVVVARSSGDYAVTEARWWPEINGQTPDQFLKAVPDSDFVVATNVVLRNPTGSEMMFTIPALYTQTAEGFIVVQGLMPDEALFGDATTTYLNGVNFFNSYKNSVSSVEGLVEGQADEVLDEIDEMADEGKYLITIYIIAHGSVDGVSLGGVGISANDFTTKMNEHPTVQFNFILGSCHSGSFIDNLSALGNVRVALTACASDEGAKPDWDNVSGTTDHNTEDSGSEWTSSLLEAAETLTSNTGYWTTILSNASTHGVPATCELLCAARYGCLGANPGFGLTQDLDLSHRLDHTTPQGYCSWEFPLYR